MDPFFSIIIPTLNEERYLPKLLRSLSKQTFLFFEVIIVDGHSRDKTVRYARKFQKKFQRLIIVNSIKRSPGVQRNRGVAEARGEYFVFFDADVQAPADFLSRLYSQILAHRFPPILTTWQTEDNRSFRNALLVNLINLLYVVGILIRKPGASGYNTIVHRNVFNDLKGFDESIYMSEDFDFTLRASAKGYFLKLLYSPRLFISLRRYHTEGSIRMILKYIQAALHTIIKGPIRTAIFDYQMGGHVHKNS